MSNSRGQSIIVIGIALIGIAVVLFCYSDTLPKVKVLPDNNISVTDNIDIADNTTENSVETCTTADEAVTQSDNNSTYDPSVDAKYPLNINTCSLEELMTIDGIGEAKASAIIEYREYLGGYTNVEQIKNIKGIGDNVYNSISPYLCV